MEDKPTTTTPDVIVRDYHYVDCSKLKDYRDDTTIFVHNSGALYLKRMNLQC